MKPWGFISAVVTMYIMASAPAIADSPPVDPLPYSGTYFIINGLNDQAMQPAGSTPGQNVLTYEYNKGGTQKWQITRKEDPVTHKPTNKYNIKLAGESTELYLNPHPIADSTAILGADRSVYILQPDGDGFTVRSVDRNGDAMYIVSSPPMNPEVHFGPKDETSKFKWKFAAAEW